MSRRAEAFVKGAVLGVIAGAVAGILLAPMSGEETRRELKKRAGELKDKATDLYAQARGSLEKKIDAIGKLGEKIDEQKYKALVVEVMDELKANRDITADGAKKLGEQLRRDWDKFKKALAA